MSTQQPELDTWLGNDHGLSPEQVDHLTQLSNDINQRYPEPNDHAVREAALATAYRLLRGETDVIEELAATRTAARTAEAAALAGLRQAALMTVDRDAPPNRHNPNGEAAFAERAGVDRMTVRRKWLGKK